MVEPLSGISDNDIMIMARTIYGEARGEGEAGMQAVAWVIRNRYELALSYTENHPNLPYWWGNSIADICQKPYQFSCWNESDPNRKKIIAITLADPIFNECYSAAADCIDGLTADITNGATSYKTTALPWPKSWGAPKDPVAVIGHQQFFNL